MNIQEVCLLKRIKFLLLIVLISVIAAIPAAAQYATSGLGSYQGEIYWLEWSAQGTDITNGLIETFSLPDGATLTVTFSGLTDSDATYPRFWTKESFSGNKLDDYYDGLDPIMIQMQSPTVYPMTLTFSRTGGLSGIPLHIIVADAEDNRDVEYWDATTDGDEWQVIELMDSSAGVTIKSYNTQALQWSNSDLTIKQLGNFPGSFFPGAIYMTQNATQVDLTIASGGGFTGVAIGIWMPFDYGDAQDYGDAAHLNLITPSGGLNPSTGAIDTLTFTQFTSTGSVASLGGTQLYIGSGWDADLSTNLNEAANLDATDDGVTFSTYNGSGTFTADVDVVNLTGSNAYLIGYLDLNSDGDFDDAGERSDTATITSSNTYTLTFSGLGPQISSEKTVRFRLGSDLSQIASPTGFAEDGEVEDYKSSEIVFPVELIDFQATPTSLGVVLNWSTASELNSDYFEVQRSDPENEWLALQPVPSTGALDRITRYQFFDSNPMLGTNYYRLRQVDLDGKEWHSHQIETTYQPGELQVWQRENRVELRGSESIVRVEIHDIAGHQIYSGWLSPSFSQTVEFPFTPSGVLLIQAWGIEQKWLGSRKINWQGE